MIIIDTGPLVALLTQQETAHEWVTQRVKRMTAPILTCEAVLTEAFFLLAKSQTGPQALWQLLERDLLRVDFAFQREKTALKNLMQKYQNIPMSLADACLVRMSEIHPQAHIFTLDSDFQIYRKNTHEVISCLAPWQPER